MLIVNACNLLTGLRGVGHVCACVLPWETLARSPKSPVGNGAVHHGLVALPFGRFLVPFRGPPNLPSANSSFKRMRIATCACWTKLEIEA